MSVSWVRVEIPSSSSKRHSALQRQRHFRQQFAAHLRTRRIIKPVQKISARGPFLKTGIDAIAGAREKRIDLADRAQAFAAPAAIADRAGPLDNTIEQGIERR